jgi:hypothetical protein
VLDTRASNTTVPCSFTIGAAEVVDTALIRQSPPLPPRRTSVRAPPTVTGSASSLASK